MNVLLVGASGFIGRAVAVALRQRGHRVVGITRDLSRSTNPDVNDGCDAWRQGDLADLTTASAWQPLLVSIEIVINAAGALGDRNEQRLTAIHGIGPAALFAAAGAVGVTRVIQISALGNQDISWSRFLSTKQIANDALMQRTDLDWAIVQPSLVFGAGGRSAQLFTSLASLPVLMLPGDGDYLIQPVHLQDVVATIVKLTEANEPLRRCIPVVGPTPIALKDFLAQLRRGMRIPDTRSLHVPAAVMTVCARVADRLPDALLNSETWRLLQAGNTGDVQPLRALLGYSPRSYQQFVAEDPDGFRKSAQSRWLFAILRGSIACVWIVTGIVSLAVYPRADSYALLARTGLTGMLATVSLYGAAILDLLMGILLLFRRRSYLWLAQMLLVTGYTLIISIALPEFWAHPYGPVLKNVVLLAAMLLLYYLE